jgi:hypothetical protein
MRILINASLMVLLLPLICLAADERPGTPSVGIIKFEDSGWILYKNDAEGYRLKLPGQLHTYLTKRRDMQLAADNSMPFDYVNFRPKEATEGLAPFELGIGVHWNRDHLGSREFADKKDVGLADSGARIVTIRQTEVVVAGIKGVRDDFRLRQPDGWRSYSRVIIPYKDNFFVFLGTLGSDTAVAEYEGVFQKIIESFQIQ